ncbi:hypothetical protein OSB04_030833 [Centaurea solstitialis]|uniref:DDE Tnp4 domain-containing protein n=1 Tax=Centaurea solstitialis TaxID=347529 RepID=A0AA38W471_9ASTR|nr:hypothetical protein OSB04_030833 [Centaurea solstitialis]
MKNHYDYLKGKYGAWAKLRNKTGNVYNASTNMFNLSEEEWQMEMKQNKFVEKLRTALLPFPELCMQLKQSATDNDLAKVVMHDKDILKKPEDVEMNLCIDKLETLGWEQSPLYDGAIGALDGTLIHAVVPSDQQARYRGRGRGECYQNVLAICDFNMVFTFVWARWEGIAHDSRVLREVVFNPTSGFPFPPPNKYYLCDAAYTCTRGFMTPYRNTRYWLVDFRRQRALTKEEMFNHAHAQLRNVIERAYGVLKARFPILKQMAPYPFHIQKDVVIACFAIHNFIRKCNIQDQLFM